MTLKTLAGGLAAVVLSTVLAPIAVSAPAQAQSQTDWYVNDDPDLWGPEASWYRGDPGRGYGANNYVYTYAIGGAASYTNFVHWEMGELGERVGRQEIQVYVPSSHATATVTYQLFFAHTFNYEEFSVRVEQRNESGWYSLGTWATNGAQVTVSLFDNEAVQHYQTDGRTSSMIGIDAVRMRCLSDCSSTGPPKVTISLGADKADCTDRSKPCRWINITLENLPADAYFITCVQEDDSGDYEAARTGYINHSGGPSATLNEFCSFNIPAGREVYVAIDLGVETAYSNFVRFEGIAPSPPPPPTSPLELVTVLVVQHVSGDTAGGTAHFTFTAECGQTSSQGASSGRPVVLREGSSNVLGPVAVTAVDEFGSTCFGYVKISGLPSHCTSRSGDLFGFPLPTGRHSNDPVIFNAVINCEEAGTAGGPPGSPRNIELRAVESSGTTDIVVSWSPPASDGGSPITGYTVTFSRPGHTFDPGRLPASSRTHTLTGARAATTYTVRVAATNAHGSSAAASDSITTPAPVGNPPGPPRNVTLTLSESADGDRLVASWSPPASDGGSPITGYTVTFSRPGHTFDPGRLPASSRTHTLTGARAATTYTVRVAATNAHGSSAAASDSITTPAPVGNPPGPPRNVTLTLSESADGDRLVASWSPPASDGGSPITGYTVTFSRPGHTFDPGRLPASSRTHTLTGARAATTYTVRVAATNAHGSSAAASDSITTPAPVGNPPGPPRNVTLTLSESADGDRLVASWSPPASDGGSPITGYTVTFSRPGHTFDPGRLPASSRTHTLTGARAATTYTVRVAATNIHGTSSPISKHFTSSTPSERPGRVVSAGYRSSRYGPLLYWRPVSGATHYEVDARESPVDQLESRSDIGCGEDDAECGYLFKNDGARSRGFRDASMFRIRAHNDAGRGPWSAWQTVTDEPPIAAVEDLESKTGELTMTEFSRTFSERFSQDTLSWSAVPNATSYDLSWRYSSETSNHNDYESSDVRCAKVCEYAFSRNPRESLAIGVRANFGARKGPWSAFLRLGVVVHIPSINAIEVQRSRNPLDKEDGVLVSWSAVDDASYYTLQWQYRELPEIGNQLPDGRDQWLEQVSDGRSGRIIMDHAECQPGEIRVYRKTEWLVDDITNIDGTSCDENNQLEFRVSARGFLRTPGGWSSWMSLANAEVGRVLTRCDAWEKVASGGVTLTAARFYPMIGEKLRWVGRFQNILHRGTAGDITWTIVRRMGKLGLVPWMAKALLLLEKCYSTPIEAMEAIPIIGDFYSITGIHKWADELISDYENCYDEFERSYLESTSTGRPWAEVSEEIRCPGWMRELAN